MTLSQIVCKSQIYLWYFMTTRLTQSTSLLLDSNILVTFAEDIIYLYVSVKQVVVFFFNFSLLTAFSKIKGTLSLKSDFLQPLFHNWNKPILRAISLRI